MALHRSTRSVPLVISLPGSPIDVFWFPISRPPGDPEQSTGRFEAGLFTVLINRGDYWQVGHLVPKGGAQDVRARGLGRGGRGRPARRRQLPTWATQGLQVLIQNRFLGPVLRGQVDPATPGGLELLGRYPALRRIPGRLVGLGILPEYVAPALRG